jgi:hypothetical protein
MPWAIWVMPRGGLFLFQRVQLDLQAVRAHQLELIRSCKAHEELSRDAFRWFNSKLCVEVVPTRVSATNRPMLIPEICVLRLPSSSIISAFARTQGLLPFPFVFLLDFVLIIPVVERHLGKKIKKIWVISVAYLIPEIVIGMPNVI